MSLTLIEAVRKRLFASPLVLFPPLGGGGVQLFAITHYTLPLPCSADSWQFVVLIENYTILTLFWPGT